MKSCRVCNKSEPLARFYANRQKCVDCYRHDSEHSSPKKLVGTIYANQKSTSKQRNHSSPSYTQKELYDWITFQPNFYELWSFWIGSNYQSNLKPSVDRIDETKGYSLNNIVLTTWAKNRAKTRLLDKCKPVASFHKDGSLIETYVSLAEASKNVGRCKSDIMKAANGQRKTCAGHMWKWI